MIITLTGATFSNNINSSMGARYSITYVCKANEDGSTLTPYYNGKTSVGENETVTFNSSNTPRVNGYSFLSATPAKIENPTGPVTVEVKYEKVESDAPIAPPSTSYTFTINPNPTSATVTLSATGYSTVSGTGSKSITVANGTKVNWSVSASGYTTRTGNWTINGGNKTENIVLTTSGGEVEPETPVTLTLHKSATGNSILDYKDVWKMFGAGSLATLGSQIIGVDVSAYAGQTITITAAQSVIAEANYAMFCSNLPNAYIKSLEELNGYNSFGTASDYKAENYDNLIESFNISTVNETTDTITKAIPTNAKYLFFSNLSAKCANPTVVIGGTAPLVVNATSYGWSCLDYQTYFYLTSNTTFQNYQSKVLAIDVSGLVGKTLSITATQSIIDGAYYSFFTKALPSGISSIEELNGLAYPGANDPKNYTFADADLVENFNVAVEHQVVNTITKVVPTGAKYLFINTLDKYGSSNIQLVE